MRTVHVARGIESYAGSQESQVEIRIQQEIPTNSLPQAAKVCKSLQLLRNPAEQQGKKAAISFSILCRQR